MVPGGTLFRRYSVFTEGCFCFPGLYRTGEDGRGSTAVVMVAVLKGSGRE